VAWVSVIKREEKMKGTVLDYNEAERTGMISGDDGKRYPFSLEDVKGNAKTSSGSKVDFDIDNGSAKDIYEAVGSMDSQFMKEKSLEAGKEALNIGRDAAVKAGNFLGRGLIKRFIAKGFEIICQISAILLPISGFIAGGNSGMYMGGGYGFNFGYAFGGLIAGILVTFVAFGLLFTILEIRDNTQKTTELLYEMKNR